ncbi:MAG: o-succinylbenzoate synthase [Bacteroidetes bacterium]|nr:o-succinylbenzoate synthase [Bacteroidota bacterium]
MKINITFIDLIFKEPAGTSRGVLYTKPSWFIEVSDKGKIGRGEISVIPGLSPEYRDMHSFNKKLSAVVAVFDAFPIQEWMVDQKEFLFLPALEKEMLGFPSIRLGFEMAYNSWLSQNNLFFLSSLAFQSIDIPINGLIWMGDIPTMKKRIKQKLAEGFSTLKMKIGSLDWKSEHKLLSELRAQFSKNELTMRVDANGAFSEKNAAQVLRDLSELEIHSIEQPLQKGLTKETRKLQDLGLVPIALDEELIGIEEEQEMLSLLRYTKASFIVIKPSLHGGFRGTVKWISCAEKLGIGWWITSALESSLGLQAIAEFTSLYPLFIPQGLGTGSIYSNNLPSRLVVQNGFLKALM